MPVALSRAELAELAKSVALSRAELAEPAELSRIE